MESWLAYSLSILIFQNNTKRHGFSICCLARSGNFVNFSSECSATDSSLEASIQSHSTKKKPKTQTQLSQNISQSIWCICWIFERPAPGVLGGSMEKYCSHKSPKSPAICTKAPDLLTKKLKENAFTETFLWRTHTRDKLREFKFLIEHYWQRALLSIVHFFSISTKTFQEQIAHWHRANEANLEKK